MNLSSTKVTFELHFLDKDQFIYLENSIKINELVMLIELLFSVHISLLWIDDVSMLITSKYEIRYCLPDSNYIRIRLKYCLKHKFTPLKLQNKVCDVSITKSAICENNSDKSTGNLIKGPCTQKDFINETWRYIKENKCKRGKKNAKLMDSLFQQVTNYVQMEVNLSQQKQLIQFYYELSKVDMTYLLSNLVEHNPQFSKKEFMEFIDELENIISEKDFFDDNEKMKQFNVKYKEFLDFLKEDKVPYTH